MERHFSFGKKGATAAAAVGLTGFLDYSPSGFAIDARNIAVSRNTHTHTHQAGPLFAIHTSLLAHKSRLLESRQKKPLPATAQALIV